MNSIFFYKGMSGICWDDFKKYKIPSFQIIEDYTGNNKQFGWGDYILDKELLYLSANALDLGL